MSPNSIHSVNLHALNLASRLATPSPLHRMQAQQSPLDAQIETLEARIDLMQIVAAGERAKIEILRDELTELRSQKFSQESEG